VPGASAIGGAATGAAAKAVWRLGDWDGTPGGFENAALMTYTHLNGRPRGNNHTFTFDIPTSAWKTDVTRHNVLGIDITSGSSGTAHLSPGASFDRMDLLA